MTQDVLTVVLNAVTNIDEAVKGFTRLQESIKEANKEVKAHDKLIDALNTKYASLNDAIKTATGGMDSMNQTVDTLRQKGNVLRDFQARMLAIGLGAKFAGMTINRFLGGIARSATNAYMEIQGRHGEFTIGVNRLAGAWEFLKFSIMDALAEAGTLDWIIDIMIAIADRVSQLSPNTLKWIGIMIIALIASSKLLGMFGDIALIIVLIGKMLELKIAKKIGGALVFAWKKVVLWTGLAYAASLKYTKLGWAKMAGYISVMAAGFKAKAIAASIVVGKILLIVGVFLLLVAVFASVYFMWDSLTKAFKIRGDQIVNNFKYTGTVIKYVFDRASQYVRGFALKAKEWIADALETPLNKAIDTVNALITAFNAVNPFSNLSKISNVGFDVDVSGDLSSLSDEIERTKKAFDDETLRYRRSHALTQLDLEDVRLQAGDDLKSGWEKILSFGKSDVEIPDMGLIGTGDSGDVEIPDISPGSMGDFNLAETIKMLDSQDNGADSPQEFNFNIVNNIDGSKDLDDQVEFDRQMDAYEEMVKRRFGSSPDT